MAMALLTTTAFERDLRRVEKQGKDLDKLEAVVDLLQAQKPCLPAVGLIRCGGTGLDIGAAMSSRTGSSCTRSRQPS
jgi:hypothetical protein